MDGDGWDIWLLCAMKIISWVCCEIAEWGSNVDVWGTELVWCVSKILDGWGGTTSVLLLLYVQVKLSINTAVGLEIKLSNVE